MSVLDSIIHDLRGLPLRKLVDVARYVHTLNETVGQEREAVLRETHGCLDEKDGLIFEEALKTSRRIEGDG